MPEEMPGGNARRKCPVVPVGFFHFSPGTSGQARRKTRYVKPPFKLELLYIFQFKAYELQYQSINHDKNILKTVPKPFQYQANSD